MSTTSKVRQSAKASLLVVLSYCLIVKIAPVEHMGDTYVYVADIIAYQDTGKLEYLLEPGHLLWRPTGYLFAYIVSLIIGEQAFQKDSVANLLSVINWVMGLAFIIVTFLLLSRMTGTRIAFVVSLCTLSINAFLNYVHSGCSYIPGLALLAMSVYFAYTPITKVYAANVLLVAFTLCLSIATWLLYVLSVPAVLLLFAFRNSQRVALFVSLVRSSMALGLMLLFLYGLSAYYLRLDSFTELFDWLKRSSHGIEHVRGVSRAAFGLARSFVYMGDDGNLFKRFLLKDPYNPVSIADLIRLSLFKLGLFYFWLTASSYLVLRYSKALEAKVALVTSIFPVAAFAMFWQGGDLERYFPLLPLLVASLAMGICTLPRHTPTVFVSTTVFIVMLFYVNLFGRTTALHAIHSQREAALQTVVHAIRQQKIGAGDLILVPILQDELMNLGRYVSPEYRLPRVTWAVWLGHRETPQWRSRVAKTILQQWVEGNHVWISTKLLQSRPKAEWKWVEGDDPRVSWRDVYEFFSVLRYGESVGSGDNRLLLLLPEESNVVVIRKHLPPTQGKAEVH